VIMRAEPSWPDSTDREERTTSGSASRRLQEHVRRRGPIAICAVVVCVSIAAAVGIERKPTYSATTQLYVQVQATDSAAVASVAEGATALAPAYSRAIAAKSVIDRVARRLGMSREDVAASVSATPIPQSPIVRLTAIADSQAKAVAIVNLTSASLSDYVSSLNRLDRSSGELLVRFRTALNASGKARAEQARLQRAYDSNPTPASRAALDRSIVNTEVAQLELDGARRRYEIAQGAPKPHLELFAPAQSASSDRSSKFQMLVFAGLLGGLLVGLALAVLADRLDSSRHDVDQEAERLKVSTPSDMQPET